MFRASQHPCTSLVTLSLSMGESPLAFTGLLGGFFLCFNILVAYGILSKAVSSTEQTFLLPRCSEVTEQMADEHSQSINWLHGHLINIHVTTLQQKFSFLEKLLYKFTVAVDFFSVFFLLLESLRCLSVVCVGLISKGIKYSLTSNGCDRGEHWEFRLRCSALAGCRELFLTIHFTPGLSLCMFTFCWAMLGVVRLGGQN